MDSFAFQLYYYMEQVGWDGKPRPASLRPKIDNAKWPEAVEGGAIRFWESRFWGRSDKANRCYRVARCVRSV